MDDLEQVQQIQVPPRFAPANKGRKIFIYIGIGILLAIFVAAGIYWYMRKNVSTGESLAIYNEETALSEDLSDLESLEADNSLENIENDLTRAAGENIIVGTASVENLATELSDELSGLSADLIGLEAVVSDISLDNLDAGLMSASQ